MINKRANLTDPRKSDDFISLKIKENKKWL